MSSMLNQQYALTKLRAEIKKEKKEYIRNVESSGT